MNRWIFLCVTLFMGSVPDIAAKEIALTFDDAPFRSSPLFESNARTDALIEKLKALKVPSVIVFANACKRGDSTSVLRQLKKYRDAGHFIGNHTCSHPRLDDIGFARYSDDAAKGDRLLSSLFTGPKFFRYPFLNEGKTEKVRNQMREWLSTQHYRNGMVSIDNDDYLFSERVSKAEELGKKVDFRKVESLFIKHLVNAADFYDALAVKTLGRSPKHILLLHERDMTVMFLEPLLKEFERRGWKLISANEAYQDKIYFEQPKNTYSGNGIIAQLVAEKTGEKVSSGHSEELKAELDKILGLRDTH